MKFLEKLKYSVTKIEKYPEMSAQGTKKAIKYISILIVILAIITALGIIYQTFNELQKASKYIEEKLPNFSYKEGTITSNEEQPIKLEGEELGVRKVIVDLKDKTEEEIIKYTNEIKEAGSGILILKDKILLENYAVDKEVVYKYSDIVNQFGINEFNKQDILNYINGSQIINVYLGLFLILFIYGFIMYITSSLWTALIIGIFGYIGSTLAKVKMKFKAIFNMAIYALTLSTLLDIIYIATNIFVNFNITYFQVMYISVAFIYLIAAIFLMRIELLKKQEELIKVVEVQKQIKGEVEKEKQEEKEEKDKKDKKEEKPKLKKKEENEGGEPEGSNV